MAGKSEGKLKANPFEAAVCRSIARCVGAVFMTPLDVLKNCIFLATEVIPATMNFAKITEISAGNVETNC